MLISGTSTPFLVSSMQAAAVFAALAFVFKHTKNAYFINGWLNSEVFELKASAELRTKHFTRLRILRNCFGIAGIVALVSFMPDGPIMLLGRQLTVALFALTMFTAVSFINRYIFFVCVVPRNIPGNYLVAAQGAVH
jgi:hypothetical protein